MIVLIDGQAAPTTPWSARRMWLNVPGLHSSRLPRHFLRPRRSRPRDHLVARPSAAAALHEGARARHHLLDPAVPPVHILEPSAYRKTNSPRHWAQEYFAGSLLMPRRWVGDFIRDPLGTPDELIREVARRFQVSRAAAAVRLRELRHIPDTR